MSAIQRWIALFGAAALFFLLLGLFWLLRGLTHRRRDRLVQRLVGQSPAIRIRAQRPRRAPDAGAGVLDRTQRALEQAGFGLDALPFLALVLGGALFMLGVGWLALGSLAGGVVLGATVLVAVRLQIKRRRQRRMDVVARQLPAALEMMTFGLRAGRGIEEAMGLAARDLEGPLGAELARCHNEHIMGRPVEDALQQLGRRWQPVRGVRLFVEAVAVLKKSGGNLVQVMESIRDQLRAREAHEARHRAMTSEGRFSGSILMALPLLALVIQVVLMPGQINEMLREAGGRALLLAALLLWAAGAAWVARLTRSGAGR